MALTIPIKHRVLFVCMGNICRSPTAEAVFRKMVTESTLADRIEIDSAGTIGSHAGSKPDPRAIDIGAARGYELDNLRARQVTDADFASFDFVVAMDDRNVQHLNAKCPAELKHKIELLMAFAADAEAREVPDPYYGNTVDFEHALALIEQGCSGLLRHISGTLVAHPLTAGQGA